MLYRKKILFIIVLSLILFTVSSQPTHARTYLFKTNSSLTLSSENSTLGTIIPISETVTRKISIKYEYGRFARPSGIPIIVKSATEISLSISSKPNWCEVNLENLEFEAPIGRMLKNGTVEFSTNLNAKISTNNALAFSQGKIIINASSNENGNIKPSSTTYEFTISPAFIPQINYNISNESLSLKTGENKNLSIYVKNNGNSKIDVEIAKNISEEGIIVLDFLNTTTIDIGENVEIPVNINAHSTKNEKSKNVNVEIVLSYRSSNDPNGNYLIADSPISFDVEVTDNDDFVDITPYIIGIFIVFIVVFFLLTFIVWLRRRH